MNFLWKYAVIILRKQICFLRIITAVVNTGPLLDLLLPVNDVFSVIYAKSFATEHKIKTIAMRKMGWFFIQDLNQQSKKTRCGGGFTNSVYPLSFILSRTMFPCLFLLDLLKYLWVYNTVQFTHPISIMIAESSSVSLLLFLLHSYVLCYCNLQLSV